MCIFWWQGGLHMEPETKEDNEHLKGLIQIFAAAHIDMGEPVNPYPGVYSRDDEEQGSRDVGVGEERLQLAQLARCSETPERADHSAWGGVMQVTWWRELGSPQE